MDFKAVKIVTAFEIDLTVELCWTFAVNWTL